METEVGVAQEVVLAEEVGSQRVPEDLPEADGIAEIVRPGLALHELRVAEHGGLSVLEGGHGVDLVLPLRLLSELDGPRPPHDGEGALLEEHVRGAGAGIQSPPRGAPDGRARLALVAPQLLAESVQAGRDGAHERIHAGGERAVGGIFHGGRAVADLGRHRHAVVGEDAVGDPGLIDDVGLDRGQPIRLINGGAEVHEVVELAACGERERGGVDAISPGIQQEQLGMIAVETSHGVSARNVVAADGVDVKCGLAVLIVVDIRAIHVEVDPHVGIEGLDCRPGVRTELVVAEAVKIEQIEFREPRSVGGDERGASAVIKKEGLDGLARRGLPRDGQGNPHEKRKRSAA